MTTNMTPENKMKNPIQPLAKDDHGVMRFKENTLVRALLDHGQATGFGLNEMACKFYTPEHADDWQQLAQLIGYSLSGYGELSYVSDDAYGAAATMADEELSEKDARIAHLEHELFMVRASASLREDYDRLAKLCEAKDEALKDAEEFVNRHSEPWYTSGQDTLTRIRKALSATSADVEAWLRERDAKAIPTGSIVVTAAWVLENMHMPNDGACAVCNPEGKHLIDGFVCTYHRAEAAAAELRKNGGK